MKYFYSIVTTAYKKEQQLETFILSVINQTYAGQVELIIVIDNSPDNCRIIAENFVEIASAKNIVLRVITNEETVGQCVSRNTAIHHTRGDVVLVLDCDCIMDHDYLEKLNEAYSFQDCDVVIGPVNIETNGRPPYGVLKKCKKNIHFYDNPQDAINRRSFLNTVTRNFSVKREFIRGSLFDPQFSHIANDPQTGFGWEDIEMGYRLYLQGARIKYLSNIPTVHMTHKPSIEDESSIPLRSLKNFRRLHEKHPEFFNITRRWSVDTYSKIKNWVRQYNKPLGQDAEWLDNHFRKHLPYKFEIKKHKRLKILTYRWHPSHQYELHKLPYDFTLALNTGSHITGSWPYETRPFPKNDKMVPIHKVNPKDFDLAIFHFDENVLHPENTNGIIDYNWGKSFRFFVEHIHLPKIGICHGTPQFRGAYNYIYTDEDLMQVIEESRNNMINFVGDSLIICNSQQALNEWKFQNSKCIWHGLDPTEFCETSRKRKVLALTNMINRPHYRGYDVLHKVSAKLPKALKPSNLNVKETRMYCNTRNNEYAYAKFNNYIKTVGEFSIYFNPTIRSPMPRSRTEAMMCGLATISYETHDVNLFIKNGVNGFYSKDIDELAEYIIFLGNNPDACTRIGKEGRKTACDIFNHDRYLYEWQETIKSIIGG